MIVIGFCIEKSVYPQFLVSSLTLFSDKMDWSVVPLWYSIIINLMLVFSHLIEQVLSLALRYISKILLPTFPGGQHNCQIFQAFI